MNKLNLKHLLLSASILGLLALLPATSQSHPGRMMHDDMDEDQMGGYMNRRGYMNGPRWNQMHRGNQSMPMMGSMMGGPMMGGSMMGGPMMGMFMGRLADLDLTDSQRDKIRDLHRAMRKQHLKLMEKMMDAGDKLSDTYADHPTDIDKIGDAYDGIYKIKRNMILQHVETRNKVVALLTKEQKEKLKSSRPFSGRHMMMQ
jgi:Spy/CpxP family protein refolding chaperone